MAKKKTPPPTDGDDYTEVLPEEVPQTGMVVSHRHVELAVAGHFDATDGYATEAEALAAAGPEPQKVYDIQKVKVKDNKLYTEYVEIHQGDGQEPRRFEITRNGGPQVHPDLKAQLQRLVPFLAHSCRQTTKTPVDIADTGEELGVEYLEFDVTGVSVGENGVTIVGSRTIWGNRKLNLVSNFIDYGDENREPWYPHADLVAAIVLDVLGEACLAIDGKCWAPQLDLFDKKAA